MPTPTYDDVVILPREWGPITVPSSFEDENGHMNVRHYFDLCLNGFQVVFDRLGIDDDYRAARGQESSPPNTTSATTRNATPAMMFRCTSGTSIGPTRSSTPWRSS